MKIFSLKLFNALAIVASICACGGRDTAGGISEETEGVVAVNDKTIEGVSQKGPFVNGSSVFLKETRKDGSLAPTGKEFYATIRNDAGEFKIENINLESQYALLTAEGYYKHDDSFENISKCQIRLNAVSNIENRETVNINLLTHFEYQRVLNLVKAGVSFEDAKKQASGEISEIFNMDINSNEKVSEDWSITFVGYDEYNALQKISFMFDYQTKKIDTLQQRSLNMNEEECKEVQNIFDSFAADIADDGLLSDSTQLKFAGYAYDYYDYAIDNIEYYGYEYVDSNEYHNEIKKHGKPTFIAYYQNLFENYANIGACTMENWGEIINFTKPLNSKKSTKHLLCTGHYWKFISQDEYESFTKKTEHTIGSMTDPRDGKTYRTIRFTTEGKTYEWMGENLIYPQSNPPTKYLPISKTTVTGIYNRDKATNHQEICPNGWHVPTQNEWDILIKYAGGGTHALLNKNWVPVISDLCISFKNKKYYVFYDKLDLMIETATYSPYSCEAFTYYFIDPEGLEYNAIDLGYNNDISPITSDEGFIRCVKN